MYSNLLPRSFFQQDTVNVAHDLIGKLLIRTYSHTTLIGIIKETEAYCGSDDPASHAYRKKTNRNSAMFGPVGHAYVYFIYGNHHCLNIVARKPDQLAGAVLIRAVVPLRGITIMQQARNMPKHSRLTNGPGNVCKAFNITHEDNHVELTQKNRLYISSTKQAIEPKYITSSPRIGISKAIDKKWRFIAKDISIKPFESYIE